MQQPIDFAELVTLPRGSLLVAQWYDDGTRAGAAKLLARRSEAAAKATHKEAGAKLFVYPSAATKPVLVRVRRNGRGLEFNGRFAYTFIKTDDYTVGSVRRSIARVEQCEAEAANPGLRVKPVPVPKKRKSVYVGDVLSVELQREHAVGPVPKKRKSVYVEVVSPQLLERICRVLGRLPRKYTEAPSGVSQSLRITHTPEMYTALTQLVESGRVVAHGKGRMTRYSLKRQK